MPSKRKAPSNRAQPPLGFIPVDNGPEPFFSINCLVSVRNEDPLRSELISSKAHGQSSSTKKKKQAVPYMTVDAQTRIIAVVTGFKKHRNSYLYTLEFPGVPRFTKSNYTLKDLYICSGSYVKARCPQDFLDHNRKKRENALQSGEPSAKMQKVEEEDEEFIIAYIKTVANFQDIGPVYYVHYQALLSPFDEWHIQSTLQPIETNINARMAMNDEIYARIKYNKEIYYNGHLLPIFYPTNLPGNFKHVVTIYCCHRCLTFLRTEFQYRRHMKKCNICAPPGNEIYRDGDLSFFEVDGSVEVDFAMNICYLGKSFIDAKTLGCNPNCFLYYVLCHHHNGLYNIVGYFSKEKSYKSFYNLACIMVLPQFFDRGYGRLLMEMEFLLSRLEGRVGSPEVPLSVFGHRSYFHFWQHRLSHVLIQAAKRGENISIDDIARRTGTARTLIKILLEKNGFQNQSNVVIPQNIIAKYDERENRYHIHIEADKLVWVPPLVRDRFSKK
ncbi:hypothetical protein PCE1_003275 [Barthelona sp. PCE]